VRPTPTRANRRTFPQICHLVACVFTRPEALPLLQAYRLVAYAFTLPLALLVSLLKKSPILIRSASSSHVAVLYGCPVLDADAYSPRCCRAPHPPSFAHASHPLPSRAPRAQPTQARCWWRWCSCAPMVLDASDAHAPPLAAGCHLDNRN